MAWLSLSRLGIGLTNFSCVEDTADPAFSRLSYLQRKQVCVSVDGTIAPIFESCTHHPTGQPRGHHSYAQVPEAMILL